ncbi:hypothetical protein ACQPXB_21275 [Amycolatopsis sp. CA-161197]|uniref:hypothetical protein n=1 Tax=Amycolatopsis sp. CA-161197 TaxID=3239922 RepID=UPI003D90E7C0
MADSRIRLQPRAFAGIEREIYVGWDNVLQTYYAHVIDGNDANGEERRLLDLGGDIGDVTDPERIVAAVRGYADVPDGLGDMLNNTRVSGSVIDTDLRELPGGPGREQNSTSVISASYRPAGVVTGLSREDINPVLAAQEWDLVETEASRTGQRETYSSGGHELTLQWDWPDSAPHNERMVSPFTVDGYSFGVNSVPIFEGLLNGALAEQNDDTTLSDMPADTFDQHLSDDEEMSSEEHRRADEELRESWFEEPPAEDEGSHAGLGL